MLDRKAVCPNNLNHKRFITVAHVSQNWLVDDRGNYKQTVDPALEITADPDEGNTWTCDECGAEAKFENA
jgi:hypothetical protein